MRAALLALLLLLSGCAHTYWTKAGATDEEFYRDSHACAVEASPPRVAAAGVEKLKVNEELYKACLFARGYRRQNSVTPPTPHWRPVTD